MMIVVVVVYGVWNVIMLVADDIALGQEFGHVVDPWKPGTSAILGGPCITRE